MTLLELFLGFFRVGLFTFGGGYGAIPLIREVVLSAGWIGEEALADMIAVSESTPGPIMVNMATYIGSVRAGVPGALAATLAVVLPSFCIILLVSMMLTKVIENRYFQAVLRGLKPCIAAIILATGLCMTVRGFLGTTGIDLRSALIAALLAVIYFGVPKLTRKPFSPVLLIVIAAVMGAAGFSL